MMKEETPRANRFHIGLFGRRNGARGCRSVRRAGHDYGYGIEEH